MRKLITLVLLLSATLCMMAQNQTSFVVADKNGNSQLVQSLIFQQKQDANRFSWKTESEADGYKQGRDIKDLLFIARANMEFSTANVDDVTEMLENLSGINQADPQAIATVLEKNDNVDFSCPSYDNQSLIVKYKDDNAVSVYPLNIINDPFDVETEDIKPLKRFNMVREAIKAPQYRETGTRGKVAVFNYFSNQLTRKTQNKMLEFMMQDLNDHDYGVEYYPYEKMTVKNLKHVIDYSSNYTAVIVISHGFAYEENSYFVIGEEYDISNYYDADYSLLIDENASQEENVPFRYRFWNEGIGAFGFDARYDYAVNVNKMQLNANVILYMGSCDAYNKNTKSNMSGTCIGWDGSNITAQAHVAVLFNNLMRGKTLADALDVKDDLNPYYDITAEQLDTWKEDPMTDAGIKCQLRGQYAISSNFDPHYLVPVKNYYRNGASYLIISPIPNKPNLPYDGPQFLKNKSYKFSNLRMINKGNVEAVDVFPQKIYIKVTPLRLDASPKTYSLKKKDNGSYGKLEIDLPDNGAYYVTAAVDEAFTNEILIRKPYIFIKATPFKENGGEWDEAEEDTPDVPAEAIDLGLPSGTKWASCNVGASKPEEYGGYYAWGETEEKEVYKWSTYIHCDGSSSTCHDLGSDISGTEYDVAHVKWGGNWCMPTLDDIDELLDNCTSEWTTLNGVNGRKFTSKINGNSIFLPAAGYRWDWDGGLSRAGERGLYWSSSQFPDRSFRADGLFFGSGYADWGNDIRGSGDSVRPVVRN